MLVLEACGSLVLYTGITRVRTAFRNIHGYHLLHDCLRLQCRLHISYTSDHLNGIFRSHIYKSGFLGHPRSVRYFFLAPCHPPSAFPASSLTSEYQGRMLARLLMLEANTSKDLRYQLLFVINAWL